VRDFFVGLGWTLGEVDRAASGHRDWLRRTIAGYVAYGLAHPDEYRLAFMVIKPYRKPYNAEEFEPGEGYRAGIPVLLALANQIEAAIKAGVIRDDLGSPMLVAQAFWASMHGLAAILIARPRPHLPWEDLDALIAAQTEILLNGLLGGSARRPRDTD